MRVLHVASEVAPFATSGGLADVVAGLPAAQAELGATAAVIVPLYRGVSDALAASKVALSAPDPLTVTVGPTAFAGALRTAQVGRVRYGFVDCPQLFDRPGTLYGPGGAGEWGDNHVRFAALGAVARDRGAALLGGAIDVVHVHDWQGGPAAVYARLADPRQVIVATIHNLAYRGIYPKTAMTDLGIPWSLFDHRHIEFWDQVSLLKGALGVANAVTTVSPTYAREILTPQLGEALDGFLAHDVRRLVGIVNGIDTVSWDPSTDAALPAAFSRGDLAGKLVCRRALAKDAGLALADSDILVGVVARMAGQKGLDLIAELVPELHHLGCKLVVLGAGEPDLESRFRYLAETFSQTISVRLDFDLAYARRIYAGSDLFVMPSRFEPCGLGQQYAMRYGTLPIVHAVGGLVDTVDDGVTGFAFRQPTVRALRSALVRAIDTVRAPDKLAAMRDAAMARDASWTSSAGKFLALYRDLVTAR